MIVARKDRGIQCRREFIRRAVKGDRLVLLSPKPTAIVDVIDINLPRPPTLEMFTDLIVKLKRRALASLYPMMLPSNA